jgi:NAD(P)-dependent dehydrogenase (short-subunit alcohol dehydrogenase family)
MTIMTASRTLVTGAGSGIGRATALKLTAHGCRVAPLNVDQASAEGSADDTTTNGGVAIPIMASVADPQAVAHAFLEMDAAFGGIDILISNAGITDNRNSLDLDHETWSQVIAINQS